MIVWSESWWVVWLCDTMDCSLPDFSVHGILHSRILEWVAIPFSGGSSQPRDRTQVSCIAGEFFTIWATMVLGSIPGLGKSPRRERLPTPVFWPGEFREL